MKEQDFTHTQSLTLVTLDSQSGLSKNQPCIHPSSSLPTSSAISLDHNPSRDNFEFKKILAVGNDSRLSISADGCLHDAISPGNSSNSSHDHTLQHTVCLVLHPFSFIC